MDTLKVSIVTVCYNAESCIEKTIQSVVKQTYSNIEYIIVDGASKDKTLDIISRYKNSISVVVSESDNGIFDAMNKGVKIATGDYIAFMNAGDSYYSSDTIATMFVSDIQDSWPDVVYGYLIHSYSFGKFVRKKLPIDCFKQFMPIGHPATFVRTSLMKESEFDCSYRIAADYNFFFHMYMTGKTFKFVNTIVADFESESGVSSSSKHMIRSLEERARVNGADRSLLFKIGLIKMKISLAVKQFLKPAFCKLFPRYMKKRAYRSVVNNPEYLPLENFVL